MDYSCWNCHAEFEEFSDSCPACGMRLAPETSAVRSGAQGGAFSRFLHCIILLLGLAVLALALGYLYLSGEHKTAFATLSDEVERLSRESAADAARPRTMRKEGKTPEEETAWILRGKVYDLLSLKPVAGARMRWTSKADGKKFEASASPSGGYKISVPKLGDGGYVLEISHKAYGRVYFDDVSPPYSTWDRGRREEETETLLSLTVVNLPILPPLEQREVELDYVMIQK